jgi:ribosome biogenesis GTPase
VVANVDQAIIVSSAGQPPPKPNLIDRYIVSALTGDITPVICMNKMDLDADGAGAMILERYRALGYETLATSTERGDGIDDLRGKLTGKASVVAGQSGVGKSSLLNAVQPRLELKVGAVTRDTHKGRHTTTTAGLIRLDFGGYVVDTPGVRSFELARVERFQLEGYFVEFVPRVRDCKFSNCTHVHEIGCAVKAAVDAGEIHVERYESYVRLFEEGNEDAPSARR